MIECYLLLGRKVGKKKCYLLSSFLYELGVLFFFSNEKKLISMIML